ncbi:MAG: hypothetical protein GC157_09045 [Frankiales bacterium]|nr:hypothetical protein [Frankiales bacterium]
MTPPTGRDNGLPPAARYVALVDVDPPVADHVLEILRDAGVPAVAEPLAGDRGMARETPPPRRPTDRVHVDLGHVLLARAVVAEALPALRADFHADAARRADAADADAAERSRRSRDELAPEDVDTLFAGIVAGFDDAPRGPVPPWPVSEDADDAPAAPRAPLSARLLRSGPAEDPAPAPPEPDEHFVPPPPPPLPDVDRVTRLAWAAMLGGPALIVLAAILRIPLEGWVVVTALVAFVGGFATLVARMHDRAPHDDGWDDGAVL